MTQADNLRPIDWQALIRLRERRVEHERERVAHERRHTQDAAQRLQQATAQHARCVQARQAQAQALRDGAAWQVRALHSGVAFTKRLDLQVAQALEKQQQAHAQHAQCRAALALQLQALRRASAALRAAQTMRERQQRELQRLRERRLDEQLDEAARQQARRAA